MRHHTEVSIHSPRRSEGRPGAIWPSKLWIRSFNPLPPPKRGETPSVYSTWAQAQHSFNPLPPPKRGETWTSVFNNGASLLLH